MRLVQLRIFSGDPSVEGDVVFIAPANVGMVAFGMAEPPCAEVWPVVGPMMLVEGSVEHVAGLISDGEISRREDPYFARARSQK